MVAALHNAETDRELVLYMEVLFSAQREWRGMFDVAEATAISKLRQLREALDREQADRIFGLEKKEPDATT